MENIKQTARMPVWRILKSRTPDSLHKELNELAAAQHYTPEELERARDDLACRLPVNQIRELDSFGVKLPTDSVDLTVSLGSFLFDMYCCAEKAPVAPLARLVHQKKLMEVAPALSADVIKVPKDAIESIRKTLLDDKAWEAAIFVAVHTIPATGTTPEKSAEVILKTSAASSFGKIIQAAAELMEKVTSEANS